jgi:cobalt-zinc-cadmium efflux system membrane fusion protein
MKLNWNYFLLAVAMLTLPFLLSCHNRNKGLTGESEGKGSLAERLADKGSREIVITREQFESSGMKLGDPVPMTFTKMIIANGYIVASPAGWAKISTLIPGRVKQISLSVGDYIKKGQLLFTLESNEIILLQQEYAEAFNQLNSLKASYERQKALSEEQITSQKDFINAESDYKSLLSKAEGLKARLRMINIDPLQVQKGTIIPVASIYSPIQGFVTKQDLVLGQFIEPQAMVMELIDIDKLQLNIHVFEKDLKDMAIGQQVLYYDPDDMERVFEATLSHIGKSIDPDTKTVMCIAQLKPADRNAFVNNLYVETQIITCQREAPAIPGQALIKEEGLYYVLALVGEREENLILRKIPVNLGVVLQEYAEVLDQGLKDILIEGGYNLQIRE